MPRYDKYLWTDIFGHPTKPKLSIHVDFSEMTDIKDPLCPACQSNLAKSARLRDMTGFQLVFCGQCGFTVGAVNYF